MLKKQYLKTRPVCKVTFRVSKKAAQSAQTIHLAGDFNGWDEQSIPMTALKSGDFTATVELETTDTSEYQFRYRYDGRHWENDWEADAYVNNGMDGENSIVRV